MKDELDVDKRLGELHEMNGKYSQYILPFLF